MESKCPKCGIKYGMLERFAQPMMCKRCADANLPSMISAFECELDADERFAISAPDHRPEKEAMRRNAVNRFLTGLGTCILTILVSMLIDKLTDSKIFILLFGPLFYGLYEMVKGAFLWFRCRPNPNQRE